MIGIDAGDVLVVSALLGAALAATMALGRRSAAERHWLLAVCVVGALATPAVRAGLPDRLAAAVDVRVLAPSPAPEKPSAEGAAAPIGQATSTFTVLGPATARRRDGAAALPWLWLAGVVVTAGRLIVALVRVRGIVRRATPIDGGPWRVAADAVGRSMQLPRSVPLLLTDRRSLLATCGWRRPVILLPREALSWAPDRVRVVLAHEMAHIARGDWGHQLAAEALRTLHWFNPLVWLVCRRLRLESERAADDAVLALGIDAPAFAEHLVAVARRLRPAASPWLPLPAMVRQSSLEGRVRAMLDQTIVRRPASFAARSLMAAATAALLVPLTALTAAAQFHSVRGTLSDPTGRPLPGAAIVLVNPSTASRYEVRSDASGRFELVGLPAATYRLEVRTLGFRTHNEELVVAGDVERPLQLLVGTLQETVTVIGDGQPEATPDADTLTRRAERRQRADARQQRAVATCAAGPLTAAGGNILPPMKVVHVSPRYPEHLRPDGVAGTVTMTATIDRQGAVRELRNLRGPNPDLETAAADAVRQWEFTTTLLNCEAIEVEMAVTVNFSTAR